ncbi:MAG: DUF1573 domain-containing protein [Planctomycetota bacterium]
MRRMFGIRIDLGARLSALLVLSPLVALAAPAAAQVVGPSPEAPNKEVNVGPRAYFPEGTSIDIGDIWDHEVKEVRFPVQNNGDRDLSIYNFQPTCGCSNARLEPAGTIAPGASAEIVVDFDPTNRPGTQSKDVNFQMNDLRAPRSRVRFNTTVNEVILVEPKLINFGVLPRGTGKEIEIRVTGRTVDFEAGVRPFRMPYLEAEVLGTDFVTIGDEVLRQTRIKLVLKSNAPVGTVAASVNLTTNDERVLSRQMNASAVIRGDLTATPPTLALNNLTAGEAFETTIDVVSRKAEPFKILGIEGAGSLDPSSLEIEVEPLTDEGDAYRVTIRGTAPAQGRRLNGELKLKTDIELEPHVSLRYFGFMRAGG